MLHAAFRVVEPGDILVLTNGAARKAKDWCSVQTGYPNEMSEMALAHTVSDKVEAAYRRGDMREKRRRLMADWAVFCASPPAARRVTWCRCVCDRRRPLDDAQATRRERIANRRTY